MLEILDIQKRYLYFCTEKKKTKKILQKMTEFIQRIRKKKRKYFINVVLIYLLTAGKMSRVLLKCLSLVGIWCTSMEHGVLAIITAHYIKSKTVPPKMITKDTELRYLNFELPLKFRCCRA